MKTVFGDANFYVALLIDRDSLHAKVVALAQSFHNFVVTTEYVLLEVANHLRGSSTGRTIFGRFFQDLQSDTHTRIIDSSSGLWQLGVALYLKRLDKQWSLTDCTSFVVMEELGLTEALTADHHFEQAGFSALLV